MPTSTSALALTVIMISQLMMVLDATVVTIALPPIATALHFSPAELSWVQNAYTLTFGGFLLLGARAGDLFGRRRTLMAGIALFTVASLAGGLADSAGTLLAARAVQGIGGAIAAPATLALLTSTVTEGAARVRALSMYTAVSAAGSSVGLVLGGLLTDWLSWRWSLFINVPVGVLLLVLAPRHLPETERHPGRFDLAGALTSTLGMTALVYGFVRAAADGWSDAGTIGSFVVGLALLAGFVAIELRVEQPITPLHLVRDRIRGAALLARLLLTSGMLGMFFFLTLYLQQVLGYSPLQTGFAFVPLSMTLFVAVRVVPKLMARYGGTRIMIAGAALSAAGTLWLTRISADSRFLTDLLGPMILFGIGAGASFMPLTLAALARVAPADNGAASGLVNVMQQLGGALGLAVLVSVFGAAQPAGGLDALRGPAAMTALTHAIATSLMASTAFLTALLVVVVVLGRWQQSADRSATVRTA